LANKLSYILNKRKLRAKAPRFRGLP